MKFGIIPELVGRLPIISSLRALDEDSLVKILCEPKNAVLKQYQAMLEMDGVELEFTPEALRAVARKSIERKTGARGLRSIMEELLQDVMYEIPSQEKVSKVQIGERCVEGKAEPVLTYDEKKRPVRFSGKLTGKQKAI